MSEDPERQEPEKLVRASIIDSNDIQMCKQANGEDWLLGIGSFGAVSPSPSFYTLPALALLTLPDPTRAFPVFAYLPLQTCTCALAAVPRRYSCSNMTCVHHCVPPPTRRLTFAAACSCGACLYRYPPSPCSAPPLTACLLMPHCLSACHCMSLLFDPGISPYIDMSSKPLLAGVQGQDEGPGCGCQDHSQTAR